MGAITNPEVGQKVSVDHPKYPGVWTVKSLGPVNIGLRPGNGTATLKAPRAMLIDPVGPPSSLYAPGELIRIESGRLAGLWVVVSDKGGTTMDVAKLGGDNGTFLRAVKGAGIVRVDPKDVLIEQ